MLAHKGLPGSDTGHTAQRSLAKTGHMAAQAPQKGDV